MRRIFTCLALAGATILPTPVLAWGYEGHQVVAEIARAYLQPQVLAKIDALLATDLDNHLTSHDMASEATWADVYRGAGHKETGAWHFVDTELDHPDLKAACFGYPNGGQPASSGPADDCVVDKIDAFAKELADPATSVEERLTALKFVLHFVGDLHQPLHAADNHDRGGNCVLLALGGPRSVNLHSYWDTTVVQELNTDPVQLSKTLIGQITPAEIKVWQGGDTRAWAMESFEVAKTSVYTLNSPPGCGDKSPVALPNGYDQAAQKVAAVQLEKAGVRLAVVLNRAFAGS